MQTAHVLIATVCLSLAGVRGASAEPASEIRIAIDPKNWPVAVELTCDADQPLTGAVAEVTGQHLEQASDHPHAPSRVTIPAVDGNPQQRGDRSFHRYSGLIGGLSSSHRYRIRCGDGQRWSEWKEHVTIHEAETYPPSPRPDRVILTFSGDPTTTQSVTWRTDTAIRSPVAEVAKAGPGPEFVMDAVRIAARTEPLLTPEHGEVRYHSATFQGLSPNTLYAYRVGEQGGLWSEWFQFRTASDEPEAFSFIYFGDAQVSIRAHVSRVFRQAALDAPRARFMIHAGDLVTTGNSDLDWGQWHGAAAWLNGMIPSVPVVGNHEMAPQKGGGRDLTPHWRPQFALPEHGPEGLTEEVYYFDFQGVRIIALNSVDADGNSQEPDDPGFAERQARKQAQWLEQRLRDNPNRWTVLSMHYPIFATWGKDQYELLMKYWKPLLDKYRVDLVLQGHEHAYSRIRVAPNTRPPFKDVRGIENRARGARLFNAETGTVHVTSVSGPKLYTLEDTIVDLVPKGGEGIQLYQIIHVDDDRLRYEAKTADGRIYDSFELRKQPGGAPNQLTEGPGTPSSIASVVEAVERSPSVQLTREQLDRYAGEYGLYTASDYKRYSIERRGDELYLLMFGEPMLISAVSPTEFVGSYPSRDRGMSSETVRVTFLLGADGEPLRFSMAHARNIPIVADRAGKAKVGAK